MCLIDETIIVQRLGLCTQLVVVVLDDWRRAAADRQDEVASIAAEPLAQVPRRPPPGRPPAGGESVGQDDWLASLDQPVRERACWALPLQPLDHRVRRRREVRPCCPGLARLQRHAATLAEHQARRSTRSRAAAIQQHRNDAC